MKKLYVNSYEHIQKVSDRINLMNLMVEHGLNLLSEDGQLMYIINKTFAVLPSYINIRKYVLEHSRLNLLVQNLSPFNAIVDCVIFNVTKSIANNYRVKLVSENLMDVTLHSINEILENRLYELHFADSDSSDIITTNKVIIRCVGNK